MPPVPMAASMSLAMPSSPKASTASREIITIWVSPTAVSSGANTSLSVRRRVSSSATSNWSTPAKRSLQMNSGLSWPKRWSPKAASSATNCRPFSGALSCQCTFGLML